MYLPTIYTPYGDLEMWIAIGKSPTYNSQTIKIAFDAMNVSIIDPQSN